jgi:hypothetical protein
MVKNEAFGVKAAICSSRQPFRILKNEKSSSTYGKNIE